MGFEINTNLGALQAYNQLAKVNAAAQKAQLRLATMKRINCAADDTSGYRVGKELNGKAAVMKSQLGNASSAKNYLATAESSLTNINDLLNQISAKYNDAQDPTKNKTAIAKDINSLAEEIDSILKNTNFNGHNLLAQSDGSELTSNDVFDAGGNVTMDFASDSYLKVDDLNTVLNGGTIADPGVASYDGTPYDIHGTDIINSEIDSIITVTFADNTTRTCHFTYTPDMGYHENGEIEADLYNSLGAQAGVQWGAGYMTGQLKDIHDIDNGKNIVSLVTTSGYDVTTAFGITKEASGGTSSGGLTNTNADAAISAASDLSAVSNNVKNALGRIGNLMQSLDQRSNFLTSAITNNTAAVSRLFDADMATEQLNATKSNIGVQIGTSMLAQMNNSPQTLLSLFR